MTGFRQIWPLPLAVIVSLLPLWPIYGTLSAAVVIIAGTVLGTGIAWWAVRRKMSILSTTSLTVAVFFVVGVPLAIPSKALFGFVPSLDGLVALAASLVQSWKQLVTVVTPVGSYEALLVPALVLSLVASVISVSLALRRKTRAFAAVPPVLSLAAAIWLGPVKDFYGILIAGAVFLLVSIWFAVSGPRGARGLTRAGAVVLIPLLAAVGLSALIAEPSRVVGRAQVEQPFVLQSATSPLAEYRAYVTGDGATSVVLSATGLSSGDRISLATLDHYDGVVYSVGGMAEDFVRLPSSLTVDASTGTPVDSVITIDDVRGPWVPLPAELGRLTFEGSGASTLTNNFFYSAPAATGAVLGGLQLGDTYRVTGIAHPLATLDEVAGMQPRLDGGLDQTVVPDGLNNFVTRNAEVEATAGGRLVSALTALQSEGYVSDGGPTQAPSRSGHGAERLAQLFSQTPMVGDAEQYAAAAAIIANQVGFPSRVVMGLVVPDGVSGSDVALTGSQMSAWIEISTTAGWVAIDPNPAIRPVPDRLPDDPTTVSRPQSGAVPPPVDVPRVQDQTPPEAASGELTPPVDPLQGILGVVAISVASALLLVGLLSAPFVTILALKRRRRSRRRGASTASARIEGAWGEFCDTAHDHGVLILESYSRRELAKLVPQERAVPLAKLADRAQFAPAAPTDTQAEEAWRAVDQVRLGLEAPLTRWHRVRARLSLRSLSRTRAFLQIKRGSRR